MYSAKKYIVFEDNLLQLLNTCPTCTRKCTVEKHVVGTFLSVTQVIKLCVIVGSLKGDKSMLYIIFICQVYSPQKMTDSSKAGTLANEEQRSW